MIHRDSSVFLLAALVGLLTGCASVPEQEVEPEPPPLLQPDQRTDKEPPVQQPPSKPQTVALFAGELPASSGVARTIELQLLGNGQARMQTDFLDGRLPLLETGEWSGREELVSVTLTGTRRLIYDESRELLFETITGGIIAVSYDRAIFGVRPMLLKELPIIGEPLLEESSWRLVSLPQRDVSPADRDLYTIIFDESGALSGRADCNRFSGQFVDMDGSLRLSALSMSRAACPAGSLSSAFASSLSAAVLYSIDDGILSLFDGAGEALAVLEQRLP